MNAELVRLRDNLTCGHCGCVFVGSDSQARKVKYERQKVFCSTACRHAHQRNLFGKPLPNRGPCGTCGKEFFSRTAKQFCSLNCYTKSAKFAAMLAQSRAKSMRPESRARNAAARRNGAIINCLECGASFYSKRTSARKFCSRPCYRTYLSKRFDRWIANPEGLALPQCYDEFLDREELACMIDGCTWTGIHLSLHINQAHGLVADDFKRAAGFNLSTGVIGRGLAVALSQRQKVGVATLEDRNLPLLLAQESLKDGAIRYRSKEALEHGMKARALAGQGPQRKCRGCGISFTQSTPFGHALYCSIRCREAHYAQSRTAHNTSASPRD